MKLSLYNHAATMHLVNQTLSLLFDHKSTFQKNLITMIDNLMMPQIHNMQDMGHHIYSSMLLLFSVSSLLETNSNFECTKVNLS